MAFGGLKGTLTGNGNSVGATNALTGSVATAPNDLIFVVFGQQTNLTAASVTDDIGNSYTPQNNGTDAGTSTGRAFWARSRGGTVTTVTVAATGSTNDYAGGVLVIEGPIQGSPVDANPANGSDTTSSFNGPATGTLNQAQQIVIGWATTPQGTGATWAATSPNLLGVQVNNGTNIKVVIGYQAVNATTSVVPVFTAGGNPVDDTLGTISFKQDLTPPFVYQTPDVSEPPHPAIFSEAPNLLESTLAQKPFVYESAPLAAKRTVLVAQTDYPNLLFSTLLPATSVTYTFRAPIIVRIPLPPKPAPSFDPPNLLLGTLFQKPFSYNSSQQTASWKSHRAIVSDAPNLLSGSLFQRPFVTTESQQMAHRKLPQVSICDAPNLLFTTLFQVPTRPFLPNTSQQTAYWRPPKAKAFDSPNLLLLIENNAIIVSNDDNNPIMLAYVGSLMGR